MLWVCVACVIILICGVVFFYAKISAILDHIDEMIDRAIEGTLTENDFSEKKASKIEAKLYRFLRAGKIDRQQAVKERDSIKSLISDISHQTKTPVANILLYTQLLDERGVLGEEEKKLLSSISSQTEKLDFLIQALVKLSRLENGMIRFPVEAAGIKETIARSLGHVYGQAAAKDIVLAVEEFQDFNLIHNPKWTAEALANILENAIKYSPWHSSIHVSVTRLDLYTKITIADEGIGISEKEYNLIFKRFYRSGTVEQQEGSGLGLYLAQLIVQQEKGYITVASRVGQGSRFSLFLLNA